MRYEIDAKRHEDADWQTIIHCGDGTTKDRADQMARAYSVDSGWYATRVAQRAVCPRCGHGVERFPCWQCGYPN